MTNDGNNQNQENRGMLAPPSLNISKLGIISRNYQKRFCNGYRDFSNALPKVLKSLDDKGCDSALFSLFGIIPSDLRNDSFCVLQQLQELNLNNIKLVFLEEFDDKEENRTAGNFIIFYKTNREWCKYELSQRFSSLTKMKKGEIDDFVKNEMPNRNCGNYCVLLCGETNGVKYSRNDRQVNDTFGLRSSISPDVKIVLNPIHDRMTRFEMKLKRKFLSLDERCVVSVWNKGRLFNGRTRDGNNPAWTVYRNGVEIEVNAIPNEFGVEIGVFDLISNHTNEVKT